MAMHKENIIFLCYFVAYKNQYVSLNKKNLYVVSKNRKKKKTYILSLLLRQRKPRILDFLLVRDIFC